MDQYGSLVGEEPNEKKKMKEKKKIKGKKMKKSKKWSILGKTKEWMVSRGRRKCKKEKERERK